MNGAETRARSDDVDALAALADEHSESIFRVCVSILRDRSLAEDAVQETLIKAWRNLDSFRGESSLRSWVLRIAHNTSISMLRKRRDEYRAPDDLLDVDGSPPRATGQGPADRATDLALRDAFEAALHELDETTRAILVLRELEGMSYQEIADALEVPMPTVKTRVLRGRRRLATLLEGWR